MKLKFRIRKFWYFNISFRTFIRYPRRYLIFISPASYSYKNNQKKFGLVWIRYCQNMTVPKKAHEILRGGPIFDHYRILSLKIWERSHVTVIHAFLSDRIFSSKLMITWLQIVRILVHFQLFKLKRNRNFEKFETGSKSKFRKIWKWIKI